MTSIYVRTCIKVSSGSAMSSVIRGANLVTGHLGDGPQTGMHTINRNTNNRQKIQRTP